jgi:uncharacterized membrane protein
MSEPTHGVSDYEVEQIIGRLLQIGVLIAAAVTLVGAVLLLAHTGAAHASYAEFKGTAPGFRSITGIVSGLFTGQPAAIVQFGLLLLILTPIVRVAFTLVAFVLQRDRLYILITSIVLVLLLFGLLFGRGG